LSESGERLREVRQIVHRLDDFRENEAIEACTIDRHAKCRCASDMSTKTVPPRLSQRTLHLLAILVGVVVIDICLGLFKGSFGMSTHPQSSAHAQVTLAHSTNNFLAKSSAHRRTSVNDGIDCDASLRPNDSLRSQNDLEVPMPETTVIGEETDTDWHHTGLCKDVPRPGFAAARERYLASFIQTTAWHAILYFHSSVPEWAVQEVKDNLERVNAVAALKLHLFSDPPPIYIYPSVDDLRQYSCANPSAVAYYDGSIHLSAITRTRKHKTRTPHANAVLDGIERTIARNELNNSLQHEYVHHLLMSNGVSRPFWLQEGAAMVIAKEEPFYFSTKSTSTPILPSQMVGPLPQNASFDVANAFYRQAYAMTHFLEQRCRLRINCGLSEWVQALNSGDANPESLFDWAIARSGDEPNRTNAALIWDEYTKLRGTHLAF
jgi:hypothetical protein